MEKNQWKYKIGSGKAPIIISFIMLSVFGGLAIWLYSTENGAFIFAGLLSVVMLIITIATVHRFLFYKVLIGKDEFYYQTSSTNGKLYKYTDVDKAWTSSGTAQNGAHQEYCNISLLDGTIIRFPFYYADSNAVEYLIKKAEKSAAKETAVLNDAKEYLIDGKVYGKTRIVIGFILLAIVAVLDAVIIKIGGFIYLLIPSSFMAISVLWLLIVRYLYFKIEIGQTGFYYRTNPFNGQHYEYNEITRCREIKKVVRHRAVGHSGSRTYYFYFEFTDIRGKTQKFQFEKPIHEREIAVLAERISKAITL